MPEQRFENLDALIESALRDSTSSEAPPGLCRKIDRELRIRAARHGELQRLRVTLLAWITVVLAAVLGVTGLVWHTDLLEHLGSNLPGGLGYYDYLVVTTVSYLAPVLGALLGILGLCRVLAMPVAVITARGGRFQHKES